MGEKAEKRKNAHSSGEGREKLTSEKSKTASSRDIIKGGKIHGNRNCKVNAAQKERD